ncbi:cytochrome b [Legionella sp.]|uniref:cytochrome b n=1 Tax=Legionella sp. TaxID=459 RepID=UPI003C8B7693
MLRNTTKSFGSLAKLFHWLIVILICTQFYLIWGQDLFPQKSLIRIQYILLHKSFGVTLFILGVLFIVWRTINLKPEAPEPQPHWKHIVAKIVHHSLLTLIILMPILGYLMSTADGRTVSFFGLFTLPNLITKNENLSTFFFQVHETLAYVLLALISLHVAAALHHHFILKDRVLKRMLPFN